MSGDLHESDFSRVSEDSERVDPARGITCRVRRHMLEILELKSENIRRCRLAPIIKAGMYLYESLCQFHRS